MTKPKPRKVEKVDDELIDLAARTVGRRLTNMLTKVEDNNHTNPVKPVEDRASLCSFCGGAGEVETEVEDYLGSVVVITINCPHEKA